MSSARIFCVLALVAGCGDIKGLGGATPPLVTFQVQVMGDLSSWHAPAVALVWGDQWLTEPFCILPPPKSDVDAPAVITQGCRDTFGFVPARVAANVPVTAAEPATLSLFDLPAADVLVGDVTSRVAYASLVLYDDVDGDGTLTLSIPHRTASAARDGDVRIDDTTDSRDIVHGASFVTMTKPDRRVAYLEGTFNPNAAFYPRSGCPAPMERFSVVGAGGFDAATAAAATLAGMLPPEDPASCFQARPADGPITITVDDSPDVQEVACTERTTDSSIRYRRPPVDSPDLAGRTTACAHLPSFDTNGQTSSIEQFVVSGRPNDRCKGLTHYTLRGCFEDVNCAIPDWDFTASPPAWWTCPVQAQP